MSPVSSCRRIALVGIATLAAAASTAAPASAGEQDAGCPGAAVSNPFAPWGDAADYQLAPGGDIEDDGATWKLRGGAKAQEGNETFMVTSPSDHRSLHLRASSSATTDAMCIGVEHTSFRFFVKRSGGTSASGLAVDVIVDTGNGHERALTVGVIGGSDDWAPSPQIPMVVNELAALHGNALDVSFRFRPMGDAEWSIDDVYVDPYRTR